MPVNATTSRWGTAVAVAFLLVATVLAYSIGMTGSFHSDDYIVIQNNPDIGNSTGFFSFPPRYRQWLYETFSLNYRAGGLDPRGYHTLNLALHLATGLVFMLLTGLTLKWQPGATENPTRPALLTGSLFLLHPVHTEAVTYISGRGSGLSACLFLLALLGFAVSQRKNLSIPLRAGGILLALIAAYGAVLSKETCVVLPLAFLLYDFCFMRGGEWVARKRRFKWLYAPLLAGVVLILFSSHTFRVQAAHWLERVDLSRLEMQPPVLLHALKLLVFPFNLTFDYDFPESGFLSGCFYFFSIAFWLALAVCAWRARNGTPPLFTFAILWFLIILSPTNSVLPRIDLLSERNLYLASMGFFLWAGVTLDRGLHRWRKKHLAPVFGIALLIIIFAFGLLVHDRNRVYENDVTLWRDTLAKSPNKSEVHYYLAMAHYFAGDMENAGRELKRLTLKDPELVQTALATPAASRQQLENYLRLLSELKQVVQSDPEQFRLYGRIYRELSNLFKGDRSLYFTRLLLGARHAQSGNFKMAEAEFRKAQLEKPHLPHAWLDLGSLYARMQNFDMALASLKKAGEHIALAPDLEPSLYFSRARLNFSRDRLEEAEADIVRGLANSKRPGEARLLLGAIRMRQGKPEDAITQWEQAADSPAQKAEARFNIAMVRIQQGKLAAGQTALEEVIQLDGNHLAARFNLAKLILDRGLKPDKARPHLLAVRKQTRDPEKLKMIDALLATLPPHNEIH